MKVNDATIKDSPLVSRANFGRQLGRTNVTLWRWERMGWIDPAINIAGRPFYTKETIEKFARRAAAGEFSRPPHAPRRVVKGAAC